MKTRIQLAFLAVALLLGLSSCNTQSGGSGEKISLGLHLTKGQTFNQLNKTTQKISQKVMGMSTTVQMVNEMYLKQEVLDVKDGVADIRITYARIRSEQENSMTGKQVYDSQDSSANADSPSFMGFAQLVGQGFEYSINEQGKVSSVRGVDALFERILGAVGEGGPQMAQVKATLKASFGDEAMKSMMEQMMGHLPPSQIAAGDTWGGEVRLAGAMAMTVANEYKLESIEADKAIVSVTGEVKTDKGAGLDLGVMNVEYDLEGTTDGTMEIDRKTGLPMVMKMNQKLKGTTKVMGMNVPMEIDQVVEVGPW
jgi:Family of unknown function (DUF6263)